MTKISIIIPVYNVEQYLKDCLKSVLAQSFADFEAICVNDGSTDDSIKILEDYAKKDQRIKIISQENKGLSGARNTGLKNIKGDYVVFLDSDDTLPDYALQTMYDIAIKSQADVVVSQRYDINRSSVKEPQANYDLYNNPLKDILKMPKCFSSVWNKMYKKEVLENKFFIEGVYFEDWPYTTILFANIKTFALTKLPCYIYRMTEGSIVRSGYSEHKINSYITGIRYVYNSFKDSTDLRVVQKRLLVAAKMCINKTYRDKQNRKKLANHLQAEIKKLHQEKIISIYKLPIKTLFRYLHIICCANLYTRNKGN